MTEILKYGYMTLFQVEASHTFYLDYEGNKVDHKPDLLFKPTSECRNILKNYRLIFKSSKEGFRILGQVKDIDTSPHKLLIPIDEGVKFTFTISLLNPYFVNFSQLPIENTRGKLYRFTNLQESVMAGAISLSKIAGSPVSSADLMTIKPKRFTTEIDIPPPTTQTRIILKDRKNISILDEKVNIDPNTGKGIINTDLSSLEDGIYSLTIDGAEETFFSSDHCFTNTIFGVVEIFNGSEPPESCRFINTTDEITPVTYIIPFAARSCIWKYNLVQRVHTISDPMSITITNQSGLSFIPESIQEYNEYIVQLPFRSDDEIELRCKDNNCTINFPESSEIPQPSFANIKFDENDHIFIDSYIYI